jgi:hypothetical protein
MGMKPAELRKHMEESAAMDFMGMLTPPTLVEQKEMAELTHEQAKEMADKTHEQGKETAEIANENAQTLADKDAEQAQDLAKTNAKLNPKVPTAKPSAPKPGTDSAPRGRPKKPASKLGEEGLKSREGATNVGRGGKTP